MFCLILFYCLKGVIYGKRLGKTNELHKNAVGNDYKDGISIVKDGLDKYK